MNVKTGWLLLNCIMLSAVCVFQIYRVTADVIL